MKVRISNIPATLMILLVVVNVNINIDPIEAFTTGAGTNSKPSSSSSSFGNLPYQQQQHYPQHHVVSSSTSTTPSSLSPSPASPRRRNTFLLYEPSSNNNDPKKEAQEKLNSGFWNALSYTEQWISDTLNQNQGQDGNASNGNNNKEGGAKSNPYARKELSYVCEMNDQILAAVASIFRRFREARERGERHSMAEDQMTRNNPTREKSILRETQVIIVPFCDYFDTFQGFEGVIQAINKARNNARDFVTDVSIKNLETMETQWNVSINGASLHPRFGEKSAKEIIEELEEFQHNGELDLEMRERIKQRNWARRSPYPTLIVELQASPPQSFEGKYIQPPQSSVTDDDDQDLANRGVLKDIVLKLESIFAKSAVLHKRTELKNDNSSEDSFYNAIGKVHGIEEVLASSPIAQTQQWVIDNDPLYNADIASFTSADVAHADSAFEFVFSNLAMNRYTPSHGGKRMNYDMSSRSYLIMPEFVSASATSLENFMLSIQSIINSIDGLSDRVSLSLMHPEHVRAEKRSPVPVLTLQWYAEGGN